MTKSDNSEMKSSKSCSFTGKCIGIPCVAALCFILFTMLYTPDTYRRTSPLTLIDSNAIDGTDSSIDRNLTDIMDVNSAIVKAFPVRVVRLIRQSSGLSSLVVLEPAALTCLEQRASKLCLKSKTLSVYRFALVDDDQAEPDLLTKIVSNSISLGWQANVEVPSRAVALKNGKTIVIVSVMESRSGYWYIHGTQNSNYITEPPRAFLGLNLSSIDISNRDKNTLLIPTPSDDFAWQFPRSRFLECNHTSATYLRKKYSKNYDKPAKINDSFLDVLAYTRDQMIKRRMTPMLAGGTGLGWYRECGIIPDTTDMDLMFPASEWNPEFEKDLKNDKKLTLYWILGKPSDSLELSVYARGIKIDYFALYEEGNQSWVGGMIVDQKAKLQWWYPKYEGACTADLKGYLFYVRCDIIKFLMADYGPGWYEPHHNANFVWYQSHNNIKRNGKWTFSEWPNVYRVFSYGF